MEMSDRKDSSGVLDTLVGCSEGYDDKDTMIEPIQASGYNGKKEGYIGFLSKQKVYIRFRSETRNDGGGPIRRDDTGP